MSRKSPGPSPQAGPGSNKTGLPLQTPSKHIACADNLPPVHYKQQSWDKPDPKRPMDTTANASRTPWLWK